MTRKQTLPQTYLTLDTALFSGQISPGNSLRRLNSVALFLSILQSNWKTGYNGAYLAHEVRCVVHRRKRKQTKANKRDRIGFIRKTRSIKQYVKITADQIVLFHPEN